MGDFVMLAAALRNHRQLHASGIAAYALLFVAVANISPARAAEHTLMPSPQTVHIGYFLASIKPVLSIESGDVVTLESVAAIVPSVVDQAGVVSPGAVPQYHRDIYGEVKDRGPGPHVLTGPIEVKGAMPGDVLEVRILDINLALDWGYNRQRAYTGALPEEFTGVWTRIIPLNRETKTAEVAKGVVVPIDRPFFGTMGLAPDPAMGRISSGPHGLVAIAVGMIIAWGSNMFGLGYGGLSLEGLRGAFTNFGFSVPIPAVKHVFSGFEYLGVILVTAIPFGIYDLVEAMDNVESAEAAGDAYPTTRVLTADGVVSLIGCLMGNPFINAVYIGHPGWKAMGGRIGYSAATGFMVIILSWFAVVSVLLALVPVVAISPILLYIGMLIGAQAFQTTPAKHAPAIVLALTPHLAAWSKTLMDGALGAAGTSAAAIGFDKLGQVGVLYHGLEVLGGGSILTGLVLGAVGVFVIEKKFVEASAFALSGAVLTFFGFMHGESVGLAVTPSVAISYTIVAVFLFGLSRSAAILSAVEPSNQKAVVATPAE